MPAWSTLLNTTLVLPSLFFLAATNEVLCQQNLSGQSDGSISTLTVAPNDSKVDFSNPVATPLPLAIGVSTAKVKDEFLILLDKAITINSNSGNFDVFPLPVPFPGVQPGMVGSGEKKSVSLGVPTAVAPSQQVAPQQFGTANFPFTTARADLEGQATNELYPYRASGRLFYLKNKQTFACTASLIKPGVLVTAAHCVADFGKKQYFSGWQYVPGYRNGLGPFNGAWEIAEAKVLDAYLQGSDPCTQSGVVCQDDIAVLAVKPKKDPNGKDVYPGASTGWYAFGWNKAGFSKDGVALVTQIGYPACLDGGTMMERNDVQAVASSQMSGNTMLGSLMCDGASGGPLLTNFGVRPTLTGTISGFSFDQNLVVGVTSWGATDPGVKQMGASPFLDSNILKLVNAICTSSSAACN